MYGRVEVQLLSFTSTPAKTEVYLHAPSSSVAPSTQWRNPPVSVVWKSGWGLESFGAWWNRRKYMLCGRLVGPQNHSGLSGIEGNTCLVECWLGPRTFRGLVESKEIPVGRSLSNSNFTISSELPGLCFLKRLAPAGMKPSRVLVQARQRCVAWQYVTAFNQPEMSPAGLCY